MKKFLSIAATIVGIAALFPQARPYVATLVSLLGCLALVGTSGAALPGRLGAFFAALGHDAEAMRAALAKPQDPPGGAGPSAPYREPAPVPAVAPAGPPAAARAGYEYDASKSLAWNTVQALTRGPGMAIALAVSLALGLGLACSANPGAKSPTLDKAAAGVVFAANVVHTADSVCAKAAADLRTQGKSQEALDLSTSCAKALRPAADALDLAADAIHTGKAVESKDVECAIVVGVRAVTKVRPLLEAAGVKLGAEVDNFLTYAAPWLDVAVTAGCPNG